MLQAIFTIKDSPNLLKKGATKFHNQRGIKKKDDLNAKSQKNPSLNNLYFLILLVIVLDPIRRYDFGRISNIKERKALKRNKMPESMPEHIRIVNVAKQIHFV